MAYSSYIQAKSRVTSPTLDNSSSILYASDNFFTLGTTFYTDASKSVTAPAGNYVIPTNFKTYYATIGSNGRFTQQPLELMTGSFDTNWTDCTGYSGSAKMDLTASYWDNTESLPWMGMKLSLSQSAEGRIYLTDDYWDTTVARFRSPFEGGFKAWQIENGKWHSAGGSPTMHSYGFVSKSLKNLDITDMKGYDLRVLNGEYHTGSNRAYYSTDTPEYSWGCAPGSQVQGVVHLAADPNRVTTTGSLIYTFRPDYWYSPSDYDSPSYVRRMPDVTHIKDKWGDVKLFSDMADCIYDVQPISNGEPPYSKTGLPRRIETWKNKGITQKGRRSFKTAAVFDGAWYTEPDYDLDNGGIGKFVFANDGDVRGSIGVAIPGISTWPDGQQIPAMMRSLIVDNDTWQYGSYSGYAYTYVNPYHWTYEINSGTAYQGEGPANKLCSYLGKPGGYDNTSANLYLANHIEEDFEVYNGNNDYNVGLALKACYDSVVAYGIATATIPNKQRFPKWSAYSYGVYNAHKYGVEGGGWHYFGTGSAVREDYPLYQKYDQFYISSSISAISAVGQGVLFGIGEYLGYSYISNYFNDAQQPWFIYGLVHNYDMSRKALNEVYNEATASKIKCAGYLWRRHEPVAGTEIYYKRTGTSYNGWLPGTPGNPGDRVYLMPSQLQSYAVWCMAYAEGMFMWNEGMQGHYGADEDRGADWYWKRQYGWNGDEYTAVTGMIWGMYGDFTHTDNGGMDWLYAGYLQIVQHKDIIEANTPWVKPEVYWNNEWKTGKYNYPVYLYNREAPISAYKLSADGTEALIITQHGCNNGYTKTDFSLRLPTKNNKQVLVSTWGNYTSVIRVKNL